MEKRPSGRRQFTAVRVRSAPPADWPKDSPSPPPAAYLSRFSRKKRSRSSRRSLKSSLRPKPPRRSHSSATRGAPGSRRCSRRSIRSAYRNSSWSAAAPSRYVPLIGERRLARLDGRRRERFQALLAELDSPDAIDRDALLAEFGALCTASDVYAPADPPCPEPPSHCDGRMYARVWAEAAALRESGELLRRFSALRIPVTVIHGEADPHPPEGVAEPLREAGVSFSSRLLPRCGHTPWREQYARGPFFDLLAREL